MAEDVVDMAVHTGGLQAGPCRTRGLGLAGGAGWHAGLPADLARAAAGMQLRTVDDAAARHLAGSYGDRAPAVLQLARGYLSGRLVEGHPVLEAEVVYCARAEFCCTAVDFLARRSRLAFLDVAAARKARPPLPSSAHPLTPFSLQCLPRVVQLLGDELGWSRARRRGELAAGAVFLDTFAI